MNDVQILVDAVFWPTLFMGALLGFGVGVLLRFRPKPCL